MKKYFVLLLFAAGILLIGWVGYNYWRSGSEIARFELAGVEGSTDLIELDPSMNPMRAILFVSYETELLAGSSTAFDYSILMKGPGGIRTFEAEGQQRDKREDNTPEYMTKSSEQVIKTFAVPAPGEYLLDWQVTPVKAKILNQSISLRRNVEPLQIPYLVAGALCFVLGFIFLIRGRRRAI